MSNFINVTACDNELIILAYQWGGSKELCKIRSSNNNIVDVAIQIVPGPFEGSKLLDGVNGTLSTKIITQLDPGDYQLVFLGLDWGGPQAFKLMVNEQFFASEPKEYGDGLVWHSPPVRIQV